MKVPELLNIASKDGPGMIVREIAEYGRFVKSGENVLTAKKFKSENVEMPYNSYQHVAGHILASYCTSPFSKRMEESFVMVWDGGMPPQLFYYQPKENNLRSLGHLFPIMGYIYINFPHAFKPFNELPSTSSPEMGLRAMSIAGKAMAYIALGEVDPVVMAEYKRVFSELEAMIEGVDQNIDLIAIVTAEFIKKHELFVISIR